MEYSLPIIISTLALTISILALVLNRLVPFKAKVFSTTPTFSLYKIPPSISGSEKNQTWWIPSFNIGLSMYNLGKLSGEIIDVRILGELESVRSNQKFEFYPKWTVNYSEFQKNNIERFVWLNEAVLSNWSPILLFGGKETSKHIILEGPRWDNKMEGVLKFRVEYIASNSNKWKEINNYELPIVKEMFEGKSTHTPYDEKIEKHRKI